METSVKTRAEELIEQLMQQLDPASPRYHVLASAKQFKSSWVDLGEKLIKVKREGLFQEWGYQDFVDYCRKEVRIKQPTAQKLTMAYHYLEQQEPELLQRSGDLHPMPDYRAVDLLRQAEEEQQLSQDEISQLRQAVLQENRSFPTIRQRFNQASQAHQDATANRVQARQTILANCRRLSRSLEAEPELGEALQSPLAALITQLETEVETETVPAPGES